MAKRQLSGYQMTGYQESPNRYKYVIQNFNVLCVVNLIFAQQRIFEI